MRLLHVALQVVGAVDGAWGSGEGAWVAGGADAEGEVVSEVHLEVGEGVVDSGAPQEEVVGSVAGVGSMMRSRVYW